MQIKIHRERSATKPGAGLQTPNNRRTFGNQDGDRSLKRRQRRRQVLFLAEKTDYIDHTNLANAHATI